MAETVVIPVPDIEDVVPSFPTLPVPEGINAPPAPTVIV